MKKSGFVLFVVAMFFVTGMQAQGMRALFVDAPDSIFPLLTRNNRADCVDFIDANMRARVTNRLDGTSELVSISNDYLELRSSANSAVQMKLLPFEGDSLLAVVRSVCAESCDSRIAFYRKSWELVNVPFQRPQVSDFFIATDSLDYLLQRCDIYLVQLSLSASDNSLTAEYTMPHYMTEEDSALVAPMLRPLVYRWKNGAFVKE